MNPRDAFAQTLNAQRVLARFLQAADYNEYVERKKREGEKPLDKKDWEARTQGGGKDEGKGKPETKEIRKKQYEKDISKIDSREKADLSEIDEMMKGLPKEDAPSVLDKALKFLDIKPNKGDSAKQKMEQVKKEIQEEYADKRKKFKDQFDKDDEALAKVSPEEAEKVHGKQESVRRRLQHETAKPGRLKKFKQELEDEAEKAEKSRKEKAEKSHKEKSRKEEEVSFGGPSVGRFLRRMPRIHIAQRVAERYAEELAKKPGRLSGEVRSKWKKILTTRLPFKDLDWFPKSFEHREQRRKDIAYELNVHPRGRPSQVAIDNRNRERDQMDRDDESMKSTLRMEAARINKSGQLAVILPIIQDAEAAGISPKRIQAVQAVIESTSSKLDILARDGASQAERLRYVANSQDVRKVVDIIKAGDEALAAAYQAAATLLR